VHDVIIGLGLFAVSGRELNLPIVAAVLTIVGYSLNDTIVIFTRIREQLTLRRKEAREDYEGLLNKSINMTLSRTLLTSLTTMVVVLFLFFMGGSVINDFAFMLVVGVIVGTYSSIFIASPVLAIWEKIYWQPGWKDESKSSQKLNFNLR
jgi:preprotein translocase SecF subunit